MDPLNFLLSELQEFQSQMIQDFQHGFFNDEDIVDIRSPSTGMQGITFRQGSTQRSTRIFGDGVSARFFAFHLKKLNN